jgi:transposase
MNKREIYIIVLNEFKLGHNAANASRNINMAFGEASTTERKIQRWFQKFRSGDMSLEEEEGRGRPPKIDDDELKALVEQNPRTTVRKIAKELDVDL